MASQRNIRNRKTDSVWQQRQVESWVFEDI